MLTLHDDVRQNGPIPTSPPSAFASLSLDPRILAALTALGYEAPTPIQQQSIPPLLEGRDVLAQAATGTRERVPSR